MRAAQHPVEIDAAFIDEADRVAAAFAQMGRRSELLRLGFRDLIRTFVRREARAVFASPAFRPRPSRARSARRRRQVVLAKQRHGRQLGNLEPKT